MNFRYRKTTNGRPARRRRRPRYRIVNRKRFICTQLFLFALVILFITNLNIGNKAEKPKRTFASVITPEAYAPENLLTPTPDLMLVQGTLMNKAKEDNVQIKHTASRGPQTTEKADSVSPEETSSRSSISKKERNLLERLVEAEAKGESLTGKIAVANVVLNRVKDEDFPDTITEVIMQKRQFSPVASGSINNQPSEESRIAVQKAVDEGYKVFGDNVLYFCNLDIATSDWMAKNKEVAMKIGKHTFYFK